ncbi:MAG TPA: hypothetical protein VH352_27895 [Pseudonocardiaceae bacterium]|nr:hypothetical protein [Pseudonocardiaceae bacterium]
MGDGFQLSVSAIGRLADSFSGQQDRFHEVGGPLREAAGSISTGDAALDAETRDVIGRVNDLFVLIGDTYGRFADALNTVVDNYQQADQQVADSYRELLDGGAESTGTAGMPIA